MAANLKIIFKGRSFQKKGDIIATKLLTERNFFLLEYLGSIVNRSIIFC